MKRRNVLFVLLGVAGLLLRAHYDGPLAESMHNYAGNVSISFALYFLFLVAASRMGAGKLVAAAAALSVVETFEATNGFGVMTNTFDKADFLANAGGVGLALAIDGTVQRYINKPNGLSGSGGAEGPPIAR